MIDRATLTLIQARMALKLRELETELGIVIEPWGGQYGKVDGSAVAKFSFRRVGAAAPATPAAPAAPSKPMSGPHLNIQKGNFDALCRRFGFVETDYQRQLSYRGTLYRLVGFNTGAPKNACTIERVSDGKAFKGPVSLVKNGFALAPKAAA